MFVFGFDPHHIKKNTCHQHHSRHPLLPEVYFRQEKTSDSGRQLFDLTAPIRKQVSRLDLNLPPDWRNIKLPHSVLRLAVVNRQVCCYWLLVNRSRDVD